MEYQNSKRYGGITCRSLFLFAIFFITLNLVQNSPVPPPVILVVSITSTNPLHMLFGIPPGPHVTTDISLSKLLKSNGYV